MEPENRKLPGQAMKIIALLEELASRRAIAAIGCVFIAMVPLAKAAEQRQFQIGVARADVTPSEPIRLTGYGGRTTNSIGVEQKLWAKALAIGSDREGPALLLTLDNCGIAEQTYREVVRRLKQAGVKQEKLAICMSHTHTGPCTTGWAPNIFSQDIPAEQQATIDRYTRELIGKLEGVALAALKDRRPSKLSWSQGSVPFARNRRMVVGNTARFGDNAAAPVDHALPVLKAEDLNGKLRAVVANYACHCTTLGGEFNKVCGDWAGYAQEYLERNHPGAIGLITIGCGADANPYPRGGADGGLALSKQHGEELAAEVKRLFSQSFTPLNAKLSARIKEIELPFGPHFTREQWAARTKESGIVGYHAKKWLARLDQGHKAPSTLYYPVGSWTFGDELALVFLPGEVVVDYALRLKKEFDASRLWVTAYANYVPCYIPSRRILAEGGYEAEGSLWYYDRPARISTNAEELIIKTVHGLVPKSFRSDPKKAEFPPPKKPQEALGTFRTKANLLVELVASEPLIESPVAIDWGADGRLWVCEMFDYPTGLDGKYKPGGRIKVLQSTKADGRYDKATLFLDGLPFPTGVMPWRKGALICTAPDILYAEDTDGDGKADLVRTNFMGFATHNFQARVNGFTWGLDGWLHGSSGLFGGKIKSMITGKVVDLSGRDFRLKPDSGEIEPVAGLSQMGRVRDDFDHWFGNDNSTLLWHYPLPDHYVRRNPHVTYPEPRVLVTKGADANKLFPASHTLERFNDPQNANRITSACGPEIYRDDLLGTNYYGNAFVCEPVHNLVTRRVLESTSVTFTARRAPDEQRSEFLASTDNWFRPVQVRTGPDGALWVVDMYRFVIEHPRWIPSNRLAQLDVRAGADKGRIYRVYPAGTKLRPIRDLTALKGDDLALALVTTNGPMRDLAHRQILERGWSLSSLSTNKAETERLAQQRGTTAQAVFENVLGSFILLSAIADHGPLPASQAQALCVLDQLGDLMPELLRLALTNAHPAVRRQAIQLSETELGITNRITIVEPRDVAGVPEAEQKVISFHFGEILTNLVADPDAGVRFQLALSLGEWQHSGAAEALAKLARHDDPWLKAAALSSSTRHAAAIFRTLDASPANADFARQLIASTSADPIQFKGLFSAVGQMKPTNDPAWDFGLLAAVLDALERRNESLVSYAGAADNLARVAALQMGNTLHSARSVAGDGSAADARRESAIALLGRAGAHSRTNAAVFEAELDILSNCLQPDSTPRIRGAALERLKRVNRPEVAGRLLRNWNACSPSHRASIVNVLLNREDWTGALLKAIERNEISPAEIGLPERQVFLKHKNETLRTLASKLFASRASPARTEIVGNYRSSAKLTGRSEKGGEVFDRNCAQCHAFRGRGHAVGPNLGEFAGKSLDDFVVALFDPNAAINPNFVAYNVETKDGRGLSGVIRSETAGGFTLLQGGGVEEKVLRSDIKEIRASQLSLMPEGLEQSMTPEDVADLVAWLKSSGPKPFGSANTGQAAAARSEFIQAGSNGLAALLKSGAESSYASWMGALPMAYCRQDGGMNRLIWKTAPLPKDLSHDATCQFRFAGAMGFASQPSGKFILRFNGQPAFDFNVALSDQTWQSPDGRVRMSYTVMENNAEDSNGVLVIEAHGSLLKAGEPAQIEVTGTNARSQRWFGIYLLLEPARSVAGAK